MSTTKTSKKLCARSQGPCRPTESGQSFRGVYDSVDVPPGVTVAFDDIIVLGDTVRIHGNALGTIYRPDTVTTFAEIGANHPPHLQVIRKPVSWLEEQI